MGRFSMRVRDKYAPGEQTGPERFRDGIGTALESYINYQEGNRAEENEMAKMGATRMPDEPRQGIMDRVRGIGGAIKRTLTGGGEPTSSGTFMPQPAGQPDITALRAPQVPGRGPSTEFVDPTRQLDEGGLPADGGRALPFPTNRRPGDVVQNALNAENRPMPGVQAAANRFGGYGSPEESRATGPGYRPPAAPVEQGARPATIAGALKPIVLRGRGGARYEIDPMRQQKIEMAGREMERDADQRRAIEGETRQQQQVNETQTRQIQAAIDAGMDPEEARARVLNGLMRYDETFGQQRTSGAMTQAERLQLETVRQQNRQALDRAQFAHSEAMQSGNADAIRRAQLALQTAEFQYRMGEDKAKGFERAADDAQRGVPTDPVNRQIATSTPEGQKRVAAAESTAQANRDSANRTRAETARSAESTATTGGRAGGPGAARTRVKINQKQYDDARKKINPQTKQPYTAEEIAKLYDIDPAVKR